MVSAKSLANSASPSDQDSLVSSEPIRSTVSREKRAPDRRPSPAASIFSSRAAAISSMSSAYSSVVTSVPPCIGASGVGVSLAAEEPMPVEPSGGVAAGPASPEHAVNISARSITPSAATAIGLILCILVLLSRFGCSSLGHGRFINTRPSPSGLAAAKASAACFSHPGSAWA